MLKVTAVVLGCEAIPALAFGVNYGWRVGGVVFLVMAAILLPAVSVIDVLDGNRRSPS